MRLIKNGEDMTQYIKSQMGICYHSDNSTKCYKNVAILFTDQFSFEDILSEFTLSEESAEVFSKCHQVTHYIGRIAFEKEKSIPKLFSRGSSACWGGFYHGVVEGYFISKKISMDNSNTSYLANEIKNVCGKKEDYKTPLTFIECNHGIGHALMFISDMDLPKSLEKCDELLLENRKNCYGGVFMENSSSSTNFDHPTKYLKPEDPFYPCNILDEKYLQTCYQYQSSYFARISNFNYVKNAKLCSEVPVPYQMRCYRLIGSNQVGGKQKPSDMLGICNSMPSKSIQRECIMGVIEGLSGRYVGDPSKMIEFCNLVSNDFKTSCWISLGASASYWEREKYSADFICNIEDSRLSSVCKNAYFDNSI